MSHKDSFLPSNTATGNRSQMSHISIESLSQIYSQSLRLKFGSAPAELFGKGEQAEKSMSKRIQEIKKQFDSTNLVNSKSQIENGLKRREDSVSISSIANRQMTERVESSMAAKKKEKRKTYHRPESASSNEDFVD